MITKQDRRINSIKIFNRRGSYNILVIVYRHGVFSSGALVFDFIATVYEDFSSIIPPKYLIFESKGITLWTLWKKQWEMEDETRKKKQNMMRETHFGLVLIFIDTDDYEWSDKIRF